MATTTKRINQQPQVLFQTELIKDPVVRHNFDILNQELRTRRQGQEPPAANGAFSPIIGFADFVYTPDPDLNRVFPSELVVTVRTRGNPIVVKLVAATVSGADAYHSFFAVSNPSFYNASADCGYYRGKLLTRAAPVFELALVQGIGIDILTLGAPESVFLEYPLPLFELVDDKVSAGLYQYKFFVEPTPANTVVAMNQLRLFAYELR